MRLRWLILAMPALFWVGTPATADTDDRIAPTALWQRLQQGDSPAPTLLDIRTPEEFADGHVPGAINIPLSELEARMSELPPDTPLIVYCRSGRRTQTAIPQLRARGYAVTEISGSMLAWRAAGLPETRPTESRPAGARR